MFVRAMVITCKMYSFRNTSLLRANLVISLLRKRSTSDAFDIDWYYSQHAESSNNVTEREREGGGGGRENNNLVKRSDTSRRGRSFQRYLTVIVRYVFIELRCAKRKDSLSLKGYCRLNSLKRAIDHFNLVARDGRPRLNIHCVAAMCLDNIRHWTVSGSWNDSNYKHSRPQEKAIKP